MDNNTLLNKASQLAENGNYDLARKYVIQAIKNDPMDTEAWWAMAHVATTDKERNRAVSKVLELEPNHDDALLMRDKIRAGSIPPLGGTARKSHTSDADYMAKALVTMIAYFVTYFIGVALNIYFLYEANQFRQQNGYKPENVGCLWLMLGLAVAFPVGICTFVTGVAMLGASMSI